MICKILPTSVLVVFLFCGCSLVNSVDNFVYGGDSGIDGVADAGSNNDTDMTGDCSGVSCYEPSANTCASSNALEINSSIGYCQDGECEYAQYTEVCQLGSCQNNACTETPCQGVTCSQPPKAECSMDGSSMVMFSASGNCSSSGVDTTCNYPAIEIICNEGCSDGACIGEPCINITCNQPPARHCNGQNLTVFDTTGRCDQGECVYGSQIIYCGDKGCHNGSCIDTDPCDGVVCNNPPASYCVDNQNLLMFNRVGNCEDGACIYNPMPFMCPIECLGGQCKDPCAGIMCDFPPATYCKDSTTLMHWNGMQGMCEAGACRYNLESLTCAQSCSEGMCDGDPCAGMVCVTPPSPYCEGNRIVEYPAVGRCENDGVCVYDEIFSDCPGECNNGMCEGGGPASDGILWTPMEGGTFTMGNWHEDAATTHTEELPLHEVSISGFEISQTEITRKQYKSCVDKGGCNMPGMAEGCSSEGGSENQDHPVSCVTWEQADQFCRFVEGSGGLPTEAQWEYAARSKGDEHIYPWGGDPPGCQRAVMNEPAAGGTGCGTHGTAPVCSNRSGDTMDGLCDMAGNVWEWVQDEFLPDYNGAPTDGSAWVPSGDGVQPRVVRGGGFDSEPDDVRTTRRKGVLPDTLDTNTGFRCVRPLGDHLSE